MSEQPAAQEFIQIEYRPVAVVNCLFADLHSGAIDFLSSGRGI